VQQPQDRYTAVVDEWHPIVVVYSLDGTATGSYIVSNPTYPITIVYLTNIRTIHTVCTTYIAAIPILPVGRTVVAYEYGKHGGWVP